MFDRVPPEIAGVIMAVAIAILRVIYDRNETRLLRVVLEAGICGGLSLTASYGISAAGLSPNWSIFAGGVIGYLGSNTVRQIAVRALERKADK
jgi:lambda family phage holin